MLDKRIVSFLLLVLGLIFVISMCRVKEKHETTDAQLTVYGYMGCPYTVKQLDLLKSNNVSYNFVSTDTATGSQALLKLMNGKRSGVPVTLNNETGKISKGFTPLSDL